MFSAVSKKGSTAPRTGFFHNFSRSELIVRRYDSSAEDVLDDVPKETVDRIKEDLLNLDGNLGPYPYDQWKKWVSLASQTPTERDPFPRVT